MKTFILTFLVIFSFNSMASDITAYSVGKDRYDIIRYDKLLCLIESSEQYECFVNEKSGKYKSISNFNIFDQIAIGDNNITLFKSNRKFSYKLKKIDFKSEKINQWESITGFLDGGQRLLFELSNVDSKSVGKYQYESSLKDIELKGVYKQNNFELLEKGDKEDFNINLSKILVNNQSFFIGRWKSKRKEFILFGSNFYSKLKNSINIKTCNSSSFSGHVIWDRSIPVELKSISNEIKESKSKLLKRCRQTYCESSDFRCNSARSMTDEYSLTSRNNIITIKNSYWEFTGGKGGVWYSSQRFFNKSTFSEIYLKDFLLKDWKKNFVQIFLKKYHSKNELYPRFLKSSELLKEVRPEDFWIEDGEIGYSFERYSIAAGTKTTPNIALEKSEAEIIFSKEICDVFYK